MGDLINFKIVLKVLSRNLLLIAASLFICVGVALIYSEDVMPFVYSALISSTIGGISFWLTRKTNENVTIQKRDAYLTVTLSWLLMSLSGCLPYIFSNSIPNFTDAFFESVSGFSTTGASILTDIEILPKSIVFWRSFTHWIGGVGIIVLVIVIMPTLRAGGYHLFTLESSLQDKIQPKIKSVGRRILLIYVLLTIAQIVLLLIGNMNLYESVCHAFGTVATGGFSPKNTSIAGYSPYIQYVIMIFMFLAGVNFVIYYYLFKREFGKVRKNEELKFYFIVVLIVGFAVTASVYFSSERTFESAFRDSFFQVISIITCTGFASADYLQWPVFAWGLIFFSMFLGGCTGSTSGSIKMARHLVLLKNFQRIFRSATQRNAIIPLRINKTNISDESNNSILSFIALYVLVFMILSTALIVLGIDAKTSTSSVATCMAGIGPGIGTVGPVSNFAHLPETAKNILSFAMILGRLEIYTVILLFIPGFWKR